MNETIEAIKAVHEFTKSVQAITEAQTKVINIQDDQINRLQKDMRLIGFVVGCLGLCVAVLLAHLSK